MTERMRKRLDRDEIEALLSPWEERPSEERLPEEDASAVQVHDFRRVDCLTSEQLANLETLQEIFARELSASLSRQVDTVVDARVVSVQQLTYSAFSTSVPCPTIFTSLSCAPLRGRMILEMNPTIASPLIDLLRESEREDPTTNATPRPFTRIEWRLIRSILSTILDALTAAWARVLPVEFHILESETKPMLLRVVADDEPVTVLGLDVVMGPSSGLVNLCVPFAALQPVLEGLQRWDPPPQDRQEEGDRQNVLENIRAAMMNVSVTLAEVPIGIEDVLNLKPDDIIDLEKPVDSELLLSVEDEPAFLGKLGRVNGKNAFVVKRSRRQSPMPKSDS